MGKSTTLSRKRRKIGPGEAAKKRVERKRRAAARQSDADQEWREIRRAS